MNVTKQDLSATYRSAMDGVRGYDPPDFGDPPQHPASQPYLYFAISEDDVGDHTMDRGALPAFANRTPSSVIWDMDRALVDLVVSNGGLVASDLIRIDYQLRYCTYGPHLPDQGFVAGINHAAEEGGSSADHVARLDFVPAGGASRIRIENLLTHPSILKVYLRARVRPLFSKPTDPSTWDFLHDPKVIEATWVKTTF